MNKIAYVLIILAVCLLTASCQKASLQGGETRPSDQPEPTEEIHGDTEPDQGEQAAKPEDESKDAAPAGTVEPSTEDPSEDASKQVDDSEQPVEKTYHMNKNYFIIPNDENGNKNVVLLTFDDGPKEKENLDRMIEILDKHMAKAIFFVNGYRVKANPELLKLLYNNGQVIGNHSWDHIELGKQTDEKIDQQITDVQNIVKETIGITPTFFRPPFASANDHVREKVKQENILYMTWSNGSLDWDDNIDNPAGVIKTVMEQLHPGSNILMHEHPWTIEALDDLLTKLEEKGYSFVNPNAIELEVK